MKKGIIVGFILATILTSIGGCNSKSNKSGTTENTETHTCATCGTTFSGSGYTDVFGEKVCSTGCTGR
jgi:protein-arginine kinase activator protein McsA